MYGDRKDWDKHTFQDGDGENISSLYPCMYMLSFKHLSGSSIGYINLRAINLEMVLIAMD